MKREGCSFGCDIGYIEEGRLPADEQRAGQMLTALLSVSGRWWLLGDVLLFPGISSDGAGMAAGPSSPSRIIHFADRSSQLFRFQMLMSEPLQLGQAPSVC